MHGQYRMIAMGHEVRITLQTLQVLKVLLTDPLDEHYGLEISRESGLPTGSIYPILTRLETAGLVTSAWENIDESEQGRRRRRYYRLTAEGAKSAHDEVAYAHQLLSPAASQSGHLRPGRLQPRGASA
jgi:PadR family transcriptional regulator, regulatory protein PadR